MRTLVIDPSESGITGEMLAAAALDLAGSVQPPAFLPDLLCRSAYCDRCTITYRSFDTKTRGGIFHLNLEVTGTASRGDLEGEAERMAMDLDLSDTAGDIFRKAVQDLLTVEPAAQYGELAEIAVPLKLLDMAGVPGCPVCSLPPGAGVPLSPVVELFARHRIPLSHSPLGRGRITVPAAALLVHIAEVVDSFPGMVPAGIFYGGDDEGNILRIIDGTTDDLVEERIVLLETNIDDVTAEVMGYTQGRLLGEGAVDVYVTPALGKKGRPVHVMTVIASRRTYRHLTRILMEETGTLGVRIYEVPRLVADRKRSPVSFDIGGSMVDIRVKYSSVGGMRIAVKPEYEDMKTAAQKTGLPLRTVSTIVMNQLEHRVPTSRE
jgi:hypothetical protein